MSISSILSTGTSALSVAQVRISVASTNISNANTEGYTAKSVDVTTRTVGGVGTGVQVIGSGSDVDDHLFESVVEATTKASYDSTIAAYYESILSAFGSTDDGSELSEALTEIETALSAAIADPDSASAQKDVIEALENWASTVNSVSDTIQATRTTADSAISEAVETANDLLHTVDDLNEQIVVAQAKGEDTSDLEDSRRTAVKELSQYVDVQYFTTSTGEMQIYTSSGKALLTSSVKELSYSASGTLTSEQTYQSDGSGSISGITVNGADLTDDLDGGEIGALIKMRDETLPELEEELANLSDTVMDAMNAISNLSTQDPPPNSVTSAGNYAAADAFSGTGSMSIVTTDSDGNVTASSDIDLSSCSTIQDVLDAVNGVSGVSASLNSDGQLVISADDSNSGIVISGDGTAGTDSKGVSHYFGFNDLLNGGVGDLAVPDSVSTNGLPMATITSTTVGDEAYVSGDTSGLQDIWSTLDSSMDFKASGNLSATQTTANTYLTNLIDDLADRSESAANTAKTSSSTQDSLSTSFVNETGVNVDEETILLTTYQQDYEAASQILTTAQAMWDSIMSMMK